jgi:hypothetical protein
MTYERITFIEKPAHCGQTIILRVTKETDILLFGVEVDKNGDEVVRPKADITYHAISKDMLKKRVPMVLSNMYGWLVRK